MKRPSLDDSLHASHGLAHFAYLGAVAVESHAWYGKVALLLCCVLLAQFCRDLILKRGAHGSPL